MRNRRGSRQAAALTHCGLAILAALISGAPFSPARAQAPGMDPGMARTLETCRAIADTAARLRCFEDATSKLAPSPSPKPGDAPSPAAPAPAIPPAIPPVVPAPDAIGDWRLVRTTNPSGSEKMVSVIHTADLTKSDLDFAGLMIRCGKDAPEVLVVLITPFPPHAHPKVVIGAPGHGTTLASTVVPPGVSLLLPAEATVLAHGAWQSLSELAIEVSDGATTVRGTVPLAGLAGALVTLAANCPAK